MNGKRIAIGVGVIVLTAGLVVACSDENACAKGAPAPAPARPAAPAKPNMVKPPAPKAPAAPKVVKPPKTKSVPDGHGGTTIVVVHDDDEDCDD